MGIGAIFFKHKMDLKNHCPVVNPLDVRKILKRGTSHVE